MRHESDRYGIDRKRNRGDWRIFNGHLVSMLGVLNGDEKRMDEAPINQESGKVQFVIAVEPPRDF